MIQVSKFSVINPQKTSNENSRYVTYNMPYAKKKNL